MARKEYGPSEGQRMMRGLVQAAKQISVEEKIKRKLKPHELAQLDLFDKMKPEDLNHKM
jgi:hypothetical protein